ncbi:MAG: hypothetical protein WDA03_01860 [Trueperaceae bacterium]|jgi:hypothetical protein
MPSDPTENLTELELDALWTIYEGHSLVIEYPEREDEDPYAHAIMEVRFEEGEAVAEVAEIPLDTARLLIDEGYLVLSEDGPVLDETEWFDEELDTNVRAEEFVLSEKGQSAIDATADGEAGELDDDFDDDDDSDDEDDWDDDEWDDDGDEWDEDAVDEDDDTN